MRTVSDLFDFSIHFISLLFISLIFLLFLLPYTFHFLNVVDHKPAHFRWGAWHLCREELLHRLSAQRPLHHGAYVEYTQESLSKQRFPEDFDYDDITIGQTLLNSYRRRADHSEEEDLSSGLSSSSISHDRTGKPVVDLDQSHESGYEIHRQNSETNRLGLSWTDKGSKSSLIVKRRLANTNSRLTMTQEVYQNWVKRSIRSKKKFIVLKQKNDVDKIINFFTNSYWSSWEKSQWNVRIEAISGFYIRHNCEKKNSRRSRYFLGTHWQDTGIAKWNQLYEWFKRFSRCWISVFALIPDHEVRAARWISGCWWGRDA